MRKFSKMFVLLAVLITVVMCAIVGVNYGKMVWDIENAGYSAPAVVSFIWAIPFVIAIVACLVFSVFMRKKDK